MDSEAFVDYEWMIYEIDGIIPGHPKIFVVDCELGLINAVAGRWPHALIILCRSHIVSNMQTNFTDACKESWTALMSHLKAIVHVPTEETFMELWQHLPTIAVWDYSLSLLNWINIYV